MITSSEKEALRDFIAIARQNHIPFVLVGANARLLAFDLKYDLPSPRTTKDWDIAVQVDWQTYEKLKTALAGGDNHLFNRINFNEHRVKHINGVLFDIIPFGEVEADNGTIVWSNTKQQMNVLGFREVHQHSEQLIIDENLVVPVATAPGLAVLKIFAYSDRSRDDDLRDFYFILDNYDKGGNEERIFDELTNLLSVGDLDYELAKAFLLGIDVRRLISDQTHEGLLSIIDELQLTDPYSTHLALLITRLGDQEIEERQRFHVAKLFKAFLNGLTKGI
jgi:predicted nucleotidyltransferase